MKMSIQRATALSKMLKRNQWVYRHLQQRKTFHSILDYETTDENLLQRGEW